MKCPNCAQENKEAAEACRKCGRDLSIPPAWFPDWRWHARALSVIYTVLVIAYFTVSFALRKMPEPFHIRKLPPEITPWLKD
ncbi:MAG: hypothetical protein AUJ52_05540 [Elusimicrobia bacterium CG1_02_63_36]|nr:MAG: hypothetical protein AUJ52_05540 [Elusimicrobia bacterium CG1_02_63_36]